MNTVLFSVNGGATMSSREISKLTGRHHRNVTADIRSMLGQLDINYETYEVEYMDSMNRRQIEIRIPIHIAATLVSRYDVKMAVRVAETAGITGKLMEALRDFDIPSDIPDMYVYAIQEMETGRIKLGISKNPNERIKQLQTGNSNTLKLIGYHKAENRYESEKMNHDENKNHRIRGEWFTEDAKLIQ